MSKRAIVVNLFAGPGAGKSSTMAGVFAGLKWKGVNCEMATEYAKDKVWEESFKVLNNQIYVFGKQQHKLTRLSDQVDVIITDSPLLLSIIYGDRCSATFHAVVLEEFAHYVNFNYFLERDKPYNPKGRVQTEEKAVELDAKVQVMLDANKIAYKVMRGSPVTTQVIVSEIYEFLLAATSGCD